MRYIPFDQAITLKELQFNEPCIECYRENNQLYGPEKIWDWNTDETDPARVSAPLYDQVKDWLREKHGIWLSVTIEYTFTPQESFNGFSYHIVVWDKDKKIEKDIAPLDEASFTTFWDDYFVAFLEGIKRAIIEVKKNLSKDSGNDSLL